MLKENKVYMFNNRNIESRKYKSGKKILAAIFCIVSLMSNSLTYGVGAEETTSYEQETTSSTQGNMLNGGMVEANAAYPEEPEIYGKAAILIDADTGAIIYEKKAYDKMYPASITKIMTGLLAVENCALDEYVTYSANAINSLPYDASRYGLSVGETVSLRDSLYMLILCSANEVAVGLAEYVSGSEEEFGKLMTERAKKAGALNTNFTNASGLHDDNHYTTAYDMAMITRAALDNPTFAGVLSTSTYTISPTSLVDKEKQIWHTHRMLVNTRESYYKYAEGGKTGYTDQAGRTLVTYASKDGMNLISVVLFSDTQHVCVDTRTLFEYGFNNFKKVNVANEETRFGQSEDSFFIANKELFKYSGKLLQFEDAYITIPKDASLGQMGYYIDYESAVADKKIAVIRYYIGNHFLGKATLKLNTQTDNDIGLVPDKESETVEYTVKDETPINIWWILGAAACVVLFAVVIVVLRKTRDKRRTKRERKKLFKESRRRQK